MNLAVHPARLQPRRTAMLGLILTALGGWLCTQVPPLTALTLWLVLLLSINEYLLPSRYQFDEAGIEIRRGPWSQQYRWERFRSFIVDRNGILLSTFPRRHPLESFRGTFLALPQHQKGEVVTWLMTLLPKI